MSVLNLLLKCPSFVRTELCVVESIVLLAALKPIFHNLDKVSGVRLPFLTVFDNVDIVTVLLISSAKSCSTFR